MKAGDPCQLLGTQAELGDEALVEMATPPADLPRDPGDAARSTASHKQKPGGLQLRACRLQAVEATDEEAIQQGEAGWPGPRLYERLQHRAGGLSDDLLQADHGAPQLARRQAEERAGAPRRHVELDPEHLTVEGENRGSRVQAADQRVERSRPLPGIRH